MWTCNYSFDVSALFITQTPTENISSFLWLISMSGFYLLTSFLKSSGNLSLTQLDSFLFVISFYKHDSWRKWQRSNKQSANYPQTHDFMLWTELKHLAQSFPKSMIISWVYSLHATSADVWTVCDINMGLYVHYPAEVIFYYNYIIIYNACLFIHYNNTGYSLEPMHRKTISDSAH